MQYFLVGREFPALFIILHLPLSFLFLFHTLICECQNLPLEVRGFIVHLVSCEGEILRILDIRGPQLVGKILLW